MPVKTIYIVRHATRLPFTMDPTTGIYNTSPHSPTQLPADPPLTSAGVAQSHELAGHLTSLLTPAAKSDDLIVYSSCFYRCLQTLAPWIQQMESAHGLRVNVRGEPGFGEWFGYSSRFTHPQPLPPRELRDRFFPFVVDPPSSDGESTTGRDLRPDPHGESIPDLHDRVARTFSHVVDAVDRERERQGKADRDVTLVVCFHAAPIIAAGRVLTGTLPRDGWEGEDFHCFTAGVSKFVRKRVVPPAPPPPSRGEDGGRRTGWWRREGGVAGGWVCEADSDTSFLSTGPERGWKFHGDESFDLKTQRGGQVRDPYGFGDDPSKL